MKEIVCKNCGGNDFFARGNIMVCKYCGSKYISEPTSCISLGDDINRLLVKCESDPKNAKKYANLVLDMDPTNKEALKYV